MTGVLVGLLLGLAAPTDDGDDESVKVTVVVVLATADNGVVDPKLRELARQVRKRDSRLTGFTLMSTEVKSIPVGESAAVPLVEKQELKITVEAAKDAKGRISLTIKPPELGEISYACTCEKFFPVVTPYQTKSGQQLIVAVMATPAAKK